jgi:hypothetical protein
LCQMPLPPLQLLHQLLGCGMICSCDYGTLSAFLLHLIHSWTHWHSIEGFPSLQNSRFIDLVGRCLNHVLTSTSSRCILTPMWCSLNCKTWSCLILLSHTTVMICTMFTSKEVMSSRFWELSRQDILKYSGFHNSFCRI